MIQRRTLVVSQGKAQIPVGTADEIAQLQDSK